MSGGSGMGIRKSRFFPLEELLAVILLQPGMIATEKVSALGQFMTGTTEEQWWQNWQMIDMECHASLLSLLPGASFGALYESYSAFCDQFAETHQTELQFTELQPNEFNDAFNEWLRPLQDRWGTTMEVKKLPQKSCLDLEKEAARCARSERRAAKKAAEEFVAAILRGLLGKPADEQPKQ